jgi:hypothetical protein
VPRKLKSGCQRTIGNLKLFRRGDNFLTIFLNPFSTMLGITLSMFLNLHSGFCSYLREKEMEEEILMQRREEEGRGKERRKALLEKEERKWKEIEASLISTIPNAGSREAAAMTAAVRAVGGDSVLSDSFARERVSSIARRIRTAQLARRALQVDNLVL